MLELVIEPRIVKSAEEFLEDPATKRGIALDGYVTGESWWDLSGPRANFNHHESNSDIEKHGVRALYRISTLSTAAQVHDAIKEHFLEYFKDNGSLKGRIYINDPDPDTTLSVWELRNYKDFECRKTPDNMKDLLYVQDRIDRTSGAYPFDLNSARMKTNYWMFAPFFDSKMDGSLYHMDAGGMKMIVDECCFRIDEYLAGRGKQQEPDTRHEIYYEGPGWAMIREIGPQARPYLFKELQKKLVITARKNGNNRIIYAVAKRTPFVDFRAKDFVEEVNRRDHELVGEGNKWGGCEDVFGSPRKTGSALPMEEIIRIMHRHLGSRFGETLNMPPEEPESDETLRRPPYKF